MRPEELAPEDVVFLDLVGTLVAYEEASFAPLSEANPWLLLDNRVGVLCNLPGGRDGRDIERILEEVGLDGFIDRDLIVAATNLPQQLPDRRAFAVAAAVAELPAERCVFVSIDATLRAAATDAGMAATAPTDSADEAGLLSDTAAPPEARLLAGEIDEDIGPTFVLTGRVVTMNDAGDVHDPGQVAISRGLIVAVGPAGEDLPEDFADAPRIDTGGTLYPGLIDLHNHFVYNVLPLWTVPRLYENRTQWPRAGTYSPEVTLPVRALAEAARSARAIVRYVEAKALVGGTTTGQGMRTRVNGGPRLFRGAMRNVEETKDARLPEAGTRVPNLYVNPERVLSFSNSLNSRTAYFYHLAEGVDDAARRTFTDLVDNDLVRPSLVGIHCLGLDPHDLGALAKAGAKAVWSPLSNLLLYGKTIDLHAVAQAKLPLAIGCDWSPSGSKNLLQELKVARWVAQAQDGALGAAELVRAVTVGAASILGWSPYVGCLAKDSFADVLVIAGADGDPYEHLIDATEPDVALILVHGIARYGDSDTMTRLHTTPEVPLEEWTLDGKTQAFNLYTPGSDLNDLSFAAAEQTLTEAMDDLPAWREAASAEGAQLLSLGLDAPSFTLELDNEYEPSPDDPAGGDEAFLLADWSVMADRVDLDTPTVSGEAYWQRLRTATNLPDGLVASLEEAYGG
jgi:5-methylthioadenosine/S-adenosylhomocysteine deaminase